METIFNSTHMAYKPLYLEKGRALLKVNKIISKEMENYDLEKVGVVLSATTPDLKKGSVVVPIMRGGVPIQGEETKKYIVIAIDYEDIYSIQA